MGMGGGVCAASVISKTGWYKLTSSSLIILNLIGAILFQVSVQCFSVQAGYMLTFISLLAMGFANMGLQGYCLEYAVYLEPNIGEAISGGTICQIFNMVSFIQLFIIEECFKGIKNNKEKLGITMTFNYALLGLALICILLTKHKNDDVNTIQTFEIDREDASVWTASDVDIKYKV